MSLLQTTHKKKCWFDKNQYQVWASMIMKSEKSFDDTKLKRLGSYIQNIFSSLAIFDYSVEVAVTTTKAVSSEVVM